MSYTIPKGFVVLECYYDGTPIVISTTREKYPGLCKSLKVGAKMMVDGMLKKGRSKEEIADEVQQHQEDLHQKILSTSNFVTNAVLEEAWGEDWKEVKVGWALNIACLLRLKRIKDDNMNGWALKDHNSKRYNTEDGEFADIYIYDGNIEKALKKTEAIMKTMRV